MKILAETLSRSLLRPYIIAEISANHAGRIENAKSLILAAKTAGADAVKLQTFTADSITINASVDEYMIPNESEIWGGRNLWELMKEAETPIDWQLELINFAKDNDIEVFSTAYDIDAVDFLVSSGVKAIKISSFDLINIPLLNYVAGIETLVLISTGMGSAEEIHRAAKIFQDRKETTCLMQCTSSYPCAPRDVNLNRHSKLKSFGFVTGYSDHTLDSVASIGAISKGALVFEKHIRLAQLESLDSQFSLNPTAFKNYVSDVRQAFESLGNDEFGATESESPSLWERPSLVALKDISVGETLTLINIGVRRPSIGLVPSALHLVLNKKSPIPLKRGQGIPPSILT